MSVCLVKSVGETITHTYAQAQADDVFSAPRTTGFPLTQKAHLPNLPFPTFHSSTAKYNLATFFPKFLYEQFSRHANIFFLFTAMIQVWLFLCFASNTCSHSLTFSYTHARTHTHTHTHTHTLSLSLTHTHTHSRTHSHTWHWNACSKYRMFRRQGSGPPRSRSPSSSA